MLRSRQREVCRHTRSASASRTVFLLLFGIMGLLAPGCRKNTNRKTPVVKGPPEHFTVVTIFGRGQKPVRVKAELALNDRQRTQGLMFRGSLDGGMLFVFPSNEVQNFWMKNTYIPLDMIFIDENKKVLGVVHEARPLSTQLVGIGQVPCRFVLEVNAGFARKHGITAGVRVSFTLPQNAN